MRNLIVCVAFVFVVACGTSYGADESEVMALALPDAGCQANIVCTNTGNVVDPCCKSTAVPVASRWLDQSAAAFSGGSVQFNPMRAAGQNATGTMHMSIPLYVGDNPLNASISVRGNGVLTPMTLDMIRTSPCGNTMCDTIIATQSTAVIDTYFGTYTIGVTAPRTLVTGEAITVRVAGFGVEFGNVRIGLQ